MTCDSLIGPADGTISFWACTPLDEARSVDLPGSGSYSVLPEARGSVTSSVQTTEATNCSRGSPLVTPDAILDPLVVIFRSDGRVHMVNEVVQALMVAGGMADLNDVGDGDRLVNRFIAPEDRERCIRAIGQMIAGVGSSSIEADLLAGDGQRRRIRWTPTTCLDGGQDVVSFAAIGRDVSAEIGLKTQLLAFDRLESVGFIAAGLTHDFNNLLAVAGGNLELALDMGEMDELARSRTEAALSAVEHCGEIAKRLLSIASRVEGSNSRVVSDASEVVGSVVDMLSGVLSPGVRVSVADGTNSIGLDIDAIHLEQILLNLVLNACDAMDDEGSILISLRVLDDPEPAVMEIIVRDDGPGISESIREEIFAPLFSTATTAGRTGLGLAMVRLLVESAGGSVRARSEVGAGTEMIVCIPVVQQGVSGAG